MCCGCGGGDSGSAADSCETTCYGLTCDEWVDYGYTCDAMEDYACDCGGCSCGADDGGSSGSQYGGGTSPSPSAPPSGAAASTAETAGVTLGLSGVSCAEYGTAEAAVVNGALGDHISGATAFGEHTCTDASRRFRNRRRAPLSADAVSIYVEVSLDATLYDDDDFGAAIGAALSSAVSSGALASSIVSYAASAGVSLDVTPTSAGAVTILFASVYSYSFSDDAAAQRADEGRSEVVGDVDDGSSSSGGGYGDGDDGSSGSQYDGGRRRRLAATPNEPARRRVLGVRARDDEDEWQRALEWHRRQLGALEEGAYDNAFNLPPRWLLNVTLPYEPRRIECDEALVGDAVCDPALNGMECGFDGGDCCAHSCTPSPTTLCPHDAAAAAAAADNGDDGDDQANPTAAPSLAPADGVVWDDSTCKAPQVGYTGATWPFWKSFGDEVSAAVVLPVHSIRIRRAFCGTSRINLI